MRKHNKLNYRQLKKFYNPKQFKFKTTKDLKELNDIIGQDRAIRAMEFGLDVKNPKYNMFLSGVKGTGKTSYCISKVKERAVLEERPDDWCYVYNFKEPDKPRSINLPAGMGKTFRDDMELLVHDLITEIPKAFISEEYVKNKNEIVKEYQKKRSELLDYLIEYGYQLEFEVKNNSTGLVFIPIKDGENLSDEEYEELDEEEKQRYEENAEILQIKALESLKKIRILEKEAKKKLMDYQKMTAHFVIKPIIEVLKERYKNYTKIVEYIEEVKENIIENISDFELIAEEDVPINFDIKEIAPKYYVNLFIDNGDQKGAPVIIENNPTYINLIGTVEYENEKGTLKTDFTMIKSGAIHKANGGYLILQAEQLLRDIHSWTALKRVLNTGKIKIESLSRQLGIASIATLSPEEIPINVKVILIGSTYIYHLLYSYDDDFHKLFKIKVDFDSVMESNFDNEMKMACFISSYCESEGLKHFDREGVIKVLEYSNRLAGSQKKMSTRFSKIIEILVEADVFANYDKSNIITGKHVERAIFERQYRSNRTEERIDEMYKEGKIVIDIKGSRVGRINGLSVLDMGDYVFGKPSVITVSTYAGDKGIINIEREVEMSGSIHDKGVMILEGYLNEKFCKKGPLGVTSKICFEQSYGGVDGDSASSTELYGILSSIGDIPIKQSIAVTGSVNQKGEIQPVGGVTEKIEGFYNICKYLGLTGDQGVIIPKQNIDELVLKDEVIDAVKQGKFQIYAVSTIEEGMEILTDKSFKEVEKLVERKLEEYNQIMKNKENHEE